MLTEITAEPKGTVTDAHEAWNWSEHVELDLSNKIKRGKKRKEKANDKQHPQDPTIRDRPHALSRRSLLTGLDLHGPTSFFFSSFVFVFHIS